MKLLSLITSLILVVDKIQANYVDLKPLPQEMIDYVNNHPNRTWTAAPSTHFKTVDDLMNRLGQVEQPETSPMSTMPMKYHDDQSMLPDSFDARDKWPKCPSIGQIRDQANCGSDWAFAAVESMSDRICIHSDSKMQVELSAADLMSCCAKCGQGCDGGNALMAWLYWVENGIVTGGSYEKPMGCQPYPFPSCQYDSMNGMAPCEGKAQTPKCMMQCSSRSNMTHINDKYYGQMAYKMNPNESDIMMELMLNGPMEVQFDMFVDFMSYKSGIYKHMAGRLMGTQHVKMIGWGEEMGMKYWIMANSWNANWGEKGFFRMLRGVNECGIESMAVAGMPKLVMSD